MKKNIILISLLIILFVFGLLIYDFSDNLDKEIINKDWFLVDNNDLYEISFKDNNFVYLKNNKKIVDFEDCKNYHFNNSTNVVKLGCGNKKAYIASFDENTLTMTIDNKENTYYSSEDLAYEENFKKQNELTDDEYKSLIAIDLSEYSSITMKELNSTYKEKKKVYIALVKETINYNNAFNMNVLTAMIKNSNQKYQLLFIDKLNETNLEKLNSYTKQKEYNDNEILVYEVGNKKFKLIEKIKITNKEEMKEKQNL
jgi:hypothetical protein